MQSIAEINVPRETYTSVTNETCVWVPRGTNKKTYLKNVSRET